MGVHSVAFGTGTGAVAVRWFCCLPAFLQRGVLELAREPELFLTAAESAPDKASAVLTV